MACLLLMTLLAATSGEPRRFYIYDWPEDLQSSWPSPTTQLMVGPKNSLLGYKHEDGLNFGAGKLINASYGLYSTNYFHLYHLVMSRLRIHPQRTTDKSQARLFVVPFDIGISAQWDKATGRYLMHQSYGGANEYPRVRHELERAVAESVLHGHDLLMINSLFDIFNANMTRLLMICANCTVINHDISRAHDMPFYKMARDAGAQLQLAWFGVPYMSAVHWTEKMTDIPWRTGRQRPVPVAFWAALNVQFRPAERLRQALYQMCEARPDACVAVAATSRHATPCYSKNSENCKSDEAKKSKFSSYVGLDLYRAAQFCMQPPGDMDGRKALSDSILLGCIPVYFHDNLLVEKYPWFFSLEVQRAAALYVPWQQVRFNNSFNIVDYIVSIPPEVVRKKQNALSALAESIVYSVPPSEFKLFAGFGGGPGARTGHTWSPPFRDAVDIILNRTFSRIERFKETYLIPEGERISSLQRWQLLWHVTKEHWREDGATG